METAYQSVSADGLQIPIVLMRQYGLEPGSGVTIELQPEGIRIVPARTEPVTIENRALRYLLTSVGDAVTVQIHLLPDKTGWQVNVYGAGMTRPAGKLIYSLSGVLLPDPSTPPEQMRRALVEISTQP